MAIDLLSIEPQKVSTDVSSYSMLIYGSPKAGKALTNDTIIPTTLGEKKISDINVGDEVFDRMGKPTTVLGVYPQGKKRVYEVTLEDGRKVLCNDEHLWTVITSKGRMITKTLREIINEGVIENRSVHGVMKDTHRFAIPINESLYFKEKKLSYDPYMMGVLLGDGCLSEHQLTISLGDNKLDILKYIENKTDSIAHKNSEHNYNYTFKLNNHDGRGSIRNVQTKDVVPEDLVGLAKEKHLPKDIFTASHKQRLAMLQGLLDTDGTIGIGSSLSKVSFSTHSKEMFDDVAKLARSLGFKASQQVCDRKDKGIDYSVTIMTQNYKKIDLFKFNSRHIKQANKVKDVKSTRDYSKIKIVSVKDLGYDEDMTCIYVDNLEHLFLANDYVVTHNTSFVHELYGDRVLHITTEKRTKALAGAMVQYVSSWAEYLQVLAQLRKPELKERFDVVSVDTVDNLLPMVERYVASKYGESQLGELTNTYGKDWAEAKSTWRNGVQMIEREGYVPCFVSHAIQNTIQIPKANMLEEDAKTLTSYNETTDKGVQYIEYLQYQPDIKPKYLAVINNMVDNILFIDSTVDSNKNEQRVIRLRETLQYQAGSTFKDIVPVIPLDPEAYKKAITDAVSHIDDEHKTDVRQADADTSDTKFDYNELMAEAQKLGQAMYKADKLDKVTAIVEDVFGKDHKLNEATEQQVEQLAVAVDQIKAKAMEEGVDIEA